MVCAAIIVSALDFRVIDLIELIKETEQCMYLSFPRSLVLRSNRCCFQDMVPSLKPVLVVVTLVVVVVVVVVVVLLQ